MPVLPFAAETGGYAVLGCQRTLVSVRTANARAIRRAGARETKKRRAIHKLRIAAGPLAVTSRGRFLDQPRARRRAARCIGGIERARAKAVAQTRVAAGAAIACFASIVRPTSGDEGTTAHRSGLVARHTSTAARNVATHVIYAKARGAVIARGTDGAIGALAAPVGHAQLVHRAIGIGGARVVAVAGARVAGIGGTAHGSHLRTAPVAVAGVNPSDAIPFAGAAPALCTLHVLATPALAIAGSVPPAGRRCAGRADRGVVWGYARGDEGTVAERTAQVASLACLSTGRGAADAVGAESGLAFAIAATRFRLALGLALRIGRAGVGLGNIPLAPVGRWPGVIGTRDEMGVLAPSGPEDRAQNQDAGKGKLARPSPLYCRAR